MLLAKENETWVIKHALSENVNSNDEILYTNKKKGKTKASHAIVITLISI